MKVPRKGYGTLRAPFPISHPRKGKCGKGHNRGVNSPFGTCTPDFRSDCKDIKDFRRDFRDVRIFEDLKYSYSYGFRPYCKESRSGVRVYNDLKSVPWLLGQTLGTSRPDLGSRPYSRDFTSDIKNFRDVT